MKCTVCHQSNQDWAKFCVHCGHQLGCVCRHCKKVNAAENKYCSECGHLLDQVIKAQKGEALPIESSAQSKDFQSRQPVIGERKYVTVMFSDLCNYTAISEKTDPEEIKEMLVRLFSEVYQIIEKYDGFVEKTMGDGAMILFGSPKAHEDDAIRAIKAAFEIHSRVKSLGREFEEKIGQPLEMHSGISTGLVVTNPVALIENRQGIAGDAVNLASRLAGLARPGEILVEGSTYRQSQRDFNFTRKSVGPIKGKTEEVAVYQALNPISSPFRIRSAFGVQACLIGRKAELSQLKEAAKRLRSGSGTIFGISGEAGTGKSRLMLEFKEQLNSDDFMWIEGHAYAYTQKIPYFPLIDMFGRIWGLDDEGSARQQKNKISEGISRLVGPRKDIEACIGTLHGFSYPETEGLESEAWDALIYQSIVEILSSLAHRGKTIFCLEDLHWADSTTIRVLQMVLPEFHYPAILLYSYRPPFTLFAAHQLSPLGRTLQEIHLKELSLSESNDMLASLLRTDSIPIQLRQFIKERTEGNPFYLEEMINSLLESNLLQKRQGRWHLDKSFRQGEIPVTVQGVIAARLDRLKDQSKRILQEASVIGRSFPFELLKRITTIRETLENRFNELERIDLIRTRSLSPDLEFIFKHALTQEVGYNTLLKKERREIHERIARVMEQLFADRISDYYETLALHYRQGESLFKAVTYLIKAGNKSLKCYALKESSQYFTEAYDLLIQSGIESPEEKSLLIDLLNQWSFLFYYEGNYKSLIELLQKHQDTADQLIDQPGAGHFYAWLGCAFWHRGEFKLGNDLLVQSISKCKKENDPEARGFAGAWLGWTLVERGRLAEAQHLAEQTLALCDSGVVASQYVHFTSLAVLGLANWHAGNRTRTAEIGDRLIDFGRRHTNSRALCLGHCCYGWSKLIAGDLNPATESFQTAARISSDPWYNLFPQLALCYAHTYLGDVDQVVNIVNRLIAFSKSSGAEYIGEPATFFQAAAMALSGQWRQGVAQMEKVLAIWLEKEAVVRWILCALILARLHLESACASKTHVSPDDIGSRNELFQKTAALLETCARRASEAGMIAIEGQAWLCMGTLSQHLGRLDDARENWRRAFECFSQCRSDYFQQQVSELLGVLETAS